MRVGSDEALIAANKRAAGCGRAEEAAQPRGITHKIDAHAAQPLVYLLLL